MQDLSIQLSGRIVKELFLFSEMKIKLIILVTSVSLAINIVSMFLKLPAIYVSIALLVFVYSLYSTGGINNMCSI